MLKASQDLQINEDPDETQVRDKGVMDDWSEYERNNDAKRHANKVFMNMLW